LHAVAGYAKGEVAARGHKSSLHHDLAEDILLSKREWTCGNHAKQRDRDEVGRLFVGLAYDGKTAGYAGLAPDESLANELADLLVGRRRRYAKYGAKFLCRWREPVLDNEVSDSAERASLGIG
jgi:hypothetical protein